MIPPPKNIRFYFGIILLAYTVVLGWTIAFNGIAATSWDESFLLFNASNLTQDTLGGIGSLLNPARWMSYNYGGVTKELMLMPFMAFFAPTPTLMRLAWAVYALFTLLCVFVVTGRLIGWKPALLTTVLLCTDSIFIKATMLAGRREEMIMIFYLWICLFCLTQYNLKQKRKWIFAAFFVMGIGCWTKIMFAGYMLGFTAVGILTPRKTLLFFKTKKNLLISLSALALGSMPFWIANIADNMPTFKIIFSAMTDQAPFQTNNFDLIRNLFARFNDLYLLVSYKAQMGFDPFENSIDIAWLILLSGACIALFCARKYPRKKLWLAIVFYLPIIPGSLFVMQYRLIGHLLMLYPLPHLLCAVFVCWLFSLKTKHIATVGAVLLLSFHTIHQQKILIHMHELTTGMNMHKSFTPAVMQSFEYLKHHNIKKVLCVVDWEFFEQSLLAGKINEVETINPCSLHYNNQIVEPPLPQITGKDIETLIDGKFADKPEFYVLISDGSGFNQTAKTVLANKNYQLLPVQRFEINNVDGQMVLYNAQQKHND